MPDASCVRVRQVLSERKLVRTLSQVPVILFVSAALSDPALQTPRFVLFLHPHFRLFLRARALTAGGFRRQGRAPGMFA